MAPAHFVNRLMNIILSIPSLSAVTEAGTVPATVAPAAT